MKRMLNASIPFILIGVLGQVPSALAADSEPTVPGPACERISIVVGNDSKDTLHLSDTQVTNGTLIKSAQIVVGHDEGGGDKTNEIQIDQTLKKPDNVSGSLTYKTDAGTGCQITFSCPIEKYSDSKHHNVCISSFQIKATPLTERDTCSYWIAVQPYCVGTNNVSAQAQVSYSVATNSGNGEKTN